MKQGDGCWTWQGSTDADGYGRAWFDGQMRQAHRVAYQLANGEIPRGLVLLHSCDNPPCCNPSHLRPGTIADNNGDMVAKRRNVRGECSPHAKITAEQSEDLRMRFRNGDSRYSLAARFGLSHREVCYIVRGERWNFEPIQEPEAKQDQQPREWRHVLKQRIAARRKLHLDPPASAGKEG